jgi:hypothetical protein
MVCALELVMADAVDDQDAALEEWIEAGLGRFGDLESLQVDGENEW